MICLCDKIVCNRGNMANILGYMGCRGEEKESKSE